MWLADDWTNFTHNEKQSNNSTNSCNNKAILLKGRALDHLILRPKFGPIPNAKKYGVFSQFQTKNSQFVESGGGGGVLHLYFI